MNFESGFNRHLVVCVLGSLAASSCNLVTSAPAGVITGRVLYNQRPAPGLSVRLQKIVNDKPEDVMAGTNLLSCITNQDGQYRFDKLGVGLFRVHFESSPLLVGGIEVGPQQVGEWNSLPVQSATTIPDFDVSYNGLIYPESGKANTYGNGVILPFHWSTHIFGVSYQAILYDISGGGHRKVFGSGWSPAVFFTLTNPLPKGNYRWVVLIDGGGSGAGKSLERNIDLDYQGD